MNGPACGESPAVGRWERVFPSTEREVREVRRWVRLLLPAHCDLAFDAELVLSELVANTAVHSPVTSMLLVLAHDRDGLRGEVHELGGPGGQVTLDPTAAAEMELLRQVPDSVHVRTDDLRESGRGLALVQRLCHDRWGVEPGACGRTAWFALAGCRCQLRARHPDWGIVPGDDRNLWQAVRTGYPGLVAADALQLMDGIREAERLGPLAGPRPARADLDESAVSRDRTRPWRQDRRGDGPRGC